MEVGELRRILHGAEDDGACALELLTAARGATERELVVAFKVALGSTMLDASRARRLLAAFETLGAGPGPAADPEASELLDEVVGLRARLDALGQTRAGLLALQETVRRLEAEVRAARRAAEDAGREVRELEGEAERLAALERELGA